MMSVRTSQTLANKDVWYKANRYFAKDFLIVSIVWYQYISLHIQNIYEDGELTQSATVKEYLTVQNEGTRQISRQVKHYNLDMIISVGYRVKSQ